jgi:acetyltransferase-like isoleucine patch superfamily enzyme
VVLKKNCKIGSHSVIMPGVTIGENSIVGACSFVSRNIPDNAMAYGVPAKIVKKLRRKKSATNKDKPKPQHGVKHGRI